MLIQSFSTNFVINSPGVKKTDTHYVQFSRNFITMDITEKIKEFRK
jgi:hypothetical protein